MKGQLWIGKLKCADCGEVLNTSAPMLEGDKFKASIAAPLVAGKCPKGCRSTFSDCNLNIVIDWEPTGGEAWPKTSTIN